MKKLSAIAAFSIVAALLSSNASIAKTAPKKITPRVPLVLCVNDTTQAIEPDGVFVLLDEKAEPIPCNVAFYQGDPLHVPKETRITLQNGTVVKNNEIFGSWLWVFVKNK